MISDVKVSVNFRLFPGAFCEGTHEGFIGLFILDRSVMGILE
jgi:hypothetical protein